MVLDAKALTWAAKNDIDTAKLKKAKVPIYGKWYFPEIPADVPLVNLETGEQEIFRERMVAGEVIYVPSAELVRAGLAPSSFSVMTGAAGGVPSTRALRTVAPEPLLAMARPPAYDDGSVALEPVDARESLLAAEEPDTTGIHLPKASIAPFVLGVGFCLVMLGAITNVIILVVGLLWMLAGAIGWVRIGLIEMRAHHAAAEGEHD